PPKAVALFFISANAHRRKAIDFSVAFGTAIILNGWGSNRFCLLNQKTTWQNKKRGDKIPPKKLIAVN
ncbi:MAG: hypothetical protein IKV43_00450, partial [Clostridia bacterium]|nr:hypothetical protein [Clostridia bacterium]